LQLLKQLLQLQQFLVSGGEAWSLLNSPHYLPYAVLRAHKTKYPVLTFVGCVTCDRSHNGAIILVEVNFEHMYTLLGRPPWQWCYLLNGRNKHWWYKSLLVRMAQQIIIICHLSKLLAM
jgi:hypothetical protein